MERFLPLPEAIVLMFPLAAYSNMYFYFSAQTGLTAAQTQRKMTVFQPKRRRERLRKRKRGRKTKRRVGDTQAPVGLTLIQFTPATSKRKKRQRSKKMHILLFYVFVFFGSYGKWLSLYLFRQRAPAVATHFSWLDDLQSPTKQPFCVDRKADSANWTYKSLYRGDVAR